MRTPVTIVTGPLGSGKTTLLRHVLRTTSRRLAIIMNEFGELAIDSKIIEGKSVRIAELAGGCVCCSLSGEFEAAVNELIKAVSPEAIIVETTGVAEPDGLLLDVEENLSDRVRIDGVVTIIDADAVVRFPQLGRAATAQLQAADLILINKIDLVTPQQRSQVEAKVRTINDRAVRLLAARCQVDPLVLFGFAPQPVTRRTEIHEPHQPAVEVVTFVTDRRLDRSTFEQQLAQLPPGVCRAKGFVRFSDGSFLFNYVAGRWDFEAWSAEHTQLVWIGQGLARHREQLIQQLRACERPDAV